MTRPRRSARRKRIKRWRRRVAAWLLPVFGPPLMGLLRRTWRVQVREDEHLATALRARGVLIALWHGRMTLGMAHHGHRGWNVLVSPSDDGGLAKIMLERYGYAIVRGSSSRGGSRAVREMLSRIDADRSAAEASKGGSPDSPGVPDVPVVIVTPDGPRGPRHSTNPGLAWLARETRCPILPIGLVCDRAWHLRSWDHFTVPKPFARVQIRYGEPLFVPPEADDAALDEHTEVMRQRLIDAEARSFDELGRGWDHPSA